MSDLLGTGHQELGVDRQLHIGLLQRLERRESCRHTGFVVQMPGAYEPAVGDQRMRQWDDEVADVQAQGPEVLDAGYVFVKAHFDVVPGDALGVDLLVPAVPGGLQRQDLSVVDGLQVIGEHPHGRAFGEPRRMGADRFQFQAAVALQIADHGADRVGVHDDRPAGLGVGRPAQVRHDRAAPRDDERDAQQVQSLADVLLDMVGPTRGAGNVEQFQQHPAQEVEVDLQAGLRVGHP
jgi:hypothetical protein